jgi:PBP1b-binding outer membrane lipoprotein LpoB
MQNKLILLAALFISGCATDAPVINTVVRRVEVPIAVPCKAEVPAPPIFNFDKLDPNQDIFEKTRALLVDRRLHMAYETELLASLNSCK